VPLVRCPTPFYPCKYSCGATRTTHCHRHCLLGAITPSFCTNHCVWHKSTHLPAQWGFPFPATKHQQPTPPSTHTPKKSAGRPPSLHRYFSLKISPPFIFPLRPAQLPLLHHSTSHQQPTPRRCAFTIICPFPPTIVLITAGQALLHLEFIWPTAILIKTPYPILSMTRLAPQMSRFTPQSQQDTL
jgi:hypothetical protein